MKETYQSKLVKIVVFVPEADADDIRKAMGQSGAGRIGNYTFCSFSTEGIGRFKPEEGASPALGQVGTIESVQEERIEAVCERGRLKEVIAAIKKVHPYEEIALDVYPLESL